MKNKVCLLVIILILSGNCVPVFAGKSHVTVTTGEYPPWSSEFLPHGGFVSHVISEAFRRQNHTVIFHYFPWERAYKLAGQGQYHATSFWADSKATRDKHAAQFLKSDPVMAAKVVFFHLKTNPMTPWQTLNDLKPYRIGTMIGETSTQILKQNGLKMRNVPKAGQVFMMILSGRIDIFPLELLTGLDILQFQFGPDQAAKFGYDPKPMFETPASLLFSKQHKRGAKLVAIFNQGLGEMKKDGTYDRFYQDLVTGRYSQPD